MGNLIRIRNSGDLWDTDRRWIGYQEFKYLINGIVGDYKIMYGVDAEHSCTFVNIRYGEGHTVRLKISNHIWKMLLEDLIKSKKTNWKEEGF